MLTTNTLRTKAVIAAAVALVPAIASAQVLTPLDTYATGIFDDSAAEIPAYDPVTQRLFVTNAADDAVDVLGVSATGQLNFIQQISFNGSPNSVAVKNGVAVVALEDSNDTQLPGTVAFFDPSTLALTGTVGVGALPDMLTFTPDGSKILVANEGEPSDDYLTDPEGSVSIIDVATQNVTTADFTSFNGQEAALNAQGIRIFGPGASAAQDLEPEYIAISPDGLTAFVSLQENNAFATVDIATSTVTALTSYGTKDHSLLENSFDPSNRDGPGGDEAISFVTADVAGLYQPDAIASYSVGGMNFIVTANEGDARDYDGFSEEVRVDDLNLDPAIYPDAATLQLDENLGRLRTSSATGDLDGDDDVDQIFSYGARSFSIFDDAGNLVFDSGDDFERLLAAGLPANFNANNDDNDSFDSRSDDKGPEPEGVVLGDIDGRTYAFIGLERVGGIMVYDITDPNAVSFVDYVNNRDFAEDASLEVADPNDPIDTIDVSNPLAGDLGPEGLVFIDAIDSPTGSPLLAVTNEVSGTTTLFSVVIPEPTTAGLLGVTAIGMLRRQR
ncbi:MAG: choice-of-anchor I family protein [Planctomycetota bacterium]